MLVRVAHLQPAGQLLTPHPRGEEHDPRPQALRATVGRRSAGVPEVQLRHLDREGQQLE